MIELKVNLRDDVSPALAEIISSLTGPKREEFNEVGARAAVNAAKEYHREYDARGGWRGKGNSRTGRSNYGENVAQGWHFRTADVDGAVIENNADHFKFKVTGGRIIPKRVEFLTIPMVDEARGRRVKDYEIFSGRKLFRVRGKRALFELLGKGKGVRAVYALVKSVTQPAWPGALPPDDVLIGAFSNAWRNELVEHIETL